MCSSGLAAFRLSEDTSVSRGGRTTTRGIAASPDTQRDLRKPPEDIRKFQLVTVHPTMFWRPLLASGIGETETPSLSSHWPISFLDC